MAQKEIVHFGRRLRHWREAAGLSQRRLAGRLGYDHTFISKIESGDRWPPPTLPHLADDLLGTGGELTALWPSVAEGRDRALSRKGTECREAPDPRPPMNESFEAGAAFLIPDLPVERRLRLPALGVTCPEHGLAGCTTTTAPEHLLRLMNKPAAVNEATVHAFAALLVTLTRANLEQTAPPTLGMVDAAERCLHVLTRLADDVADPVANWLWHLAAQYAHLAGWLRVERGQFGLGMSWFGRGADWGRASGNLLATCECLGRMSLVARLERDDRCAVAYAEAIRAVGGGRSWADALTELHLLRGYAVGGHRPGLERHARNARELLEHGVFDPVETPWMCGAKGRAYIESSVSAGFRDIAVLSGDRGVAGEALTSARVALDNVSTRMRPSQVLLTVRLADAYACAGQPDAAVATATEVLPEALASRTTLIDAELRGLRGRLLRGWADTPDVREFDELLRAGPRARFTGPCSR